MYQLIEQKTFVVVMHCLEVVIDNSNLIKSKDLFNLNSVVEKLVGIHNEMVVKDGRHRQEKTRFVLNYLCLIASKTHLNMADM